MSKKRAGSQKSPTLHTLVIEDVRSAWEKMYWDVDVFGDVQRAYPEEHEPLAYTALNACNSASNLENWSMAAWKKLLRQKRLRFESKEFFDLLTDLIPIQGLCVDVAITAKHGNHREERWHGGQLALRYEEASEHSPSGFTVLNMRNNQLSHLYNDIHDLPRLWWKFLREIDLVSGEQPTPAWWQRKISRMFGGS